MSELVLPDVFHKYQAIHSPSWVTKVERILHYTCQKEGFEAHLINSRSCFGLVVHGMWKGKHAVLKLICPDEQQSKDEITAATQLKYSFMCPVYVAHQSEGYYISYEAKLINLPPVEQFHTRFICIKNIFSEVIQQVEPYKMDVTSYLKILRTTLRNSLLHKSAPSELINHLHLALSYYIEWFGQETWYPLHGDLHEGNILCGECRLIAIDPLGILAPKEFEFPRYIENQLFSSLNKNDYLFGLHVLLDDFASIGASPLRMLQALRIDTVLRTAMSFLRGEPYSIIQRGISNVEWIEILRTEVKV